MKKITQYFFNNFLSGLITMDKIDFKFIKKIVLKKSIDYNY